MVVEGAVCPLNPLIQDEAYWIGREAIMRFAGLNHAGANRIEVEIRIRRRSLALKDFAMTVAASTS